MIPIEHTLTTLNVKYCILQLIQFYAVQPNWSIQRNRMQLYSQQAVLLVINSIGNDYVTILEIMSSDTTLTQAVMIDH